MPAGNAPAAAFGFGTPFAEQLDFFRRKLNLPTEQLGDIERAAHDRAFVVVGAAKADLLQDLRQAVDAHMAEGGSARSFTPLFRDVVARNGWTGWTGEGSAAGEAWRARVIYQTNMSTSYAAGRWRQMTDPEFAKLMPYWVYRHSDGVSHPRRLYLAWNGLTLPVGHEFWQTHFAPNGWGCQCKIFAVRKPAPGAATEPPAGWDAIDPRTGAPVGIDEGWNYAPGANAATPLQTLLDRKLVNLSAPIGAEMWQALAPALAMEREQAWWATLDEWTADPLPRGRRAVVGAIEPRTLQALTDAGDPLPRTAEIAIEDRIVVGAKQRRHERSQNALDSAGWRALPSLLDQPANVYVDEKSGHLIFLTDGVGPTKAALEYAFGADGASNLIVSAFRVTDTDIVSAVKNHQWRLLQ